MRSEPSKGVQKRAYLLVSWLPAFFLCGLISSCLITWPPKLEDLAQLPVLGWIGVVFLTIVSARILRRLEGSPESIQSLGGISFSCLVSLLCLWIMLGFYVGVEFFYLLAYSLLLSASCALLLFWPRKPKKPEKAVEPPLPPIPLGPGELEKIQKKVLAYIKEHNGVVERKKCLVELGITDQLFVAAVRGLEKAGKVRIKEGVLF